MIQINASEGNESLTLTQKDKLFVDNINDIITMYGQIPYTVPQKLIVNSIIDTGRLFYDQYYKATSKRFYRIPYEMFTNMDYRNVVEITSMGCIVKLPSFVRAIYDLHETKKNRPLAIALVGNSGGTRTGNGSILGINSYLYSMELAARMVAENANSSIFGREIPFKFNALENSLIIHDNVTKDIILECYAAVDIQDLYKDGYFKRYVLAITKRELKRVIGGHTFNLPGNVTVNADEICNNLEDSEKIEELLKAGNGIGDIIMMRD